MADRPDADWATMGTLPNLLSISRLIVVAPLLASAFLGRPGLFSILLGYALLSDAADGFVARLLRQTSTLGARLDSLADCVFYLTAPVATVILEPWLLVREWGAVAALLLGYLVPITYGFFKYHRLTAYHAASARAAGVLIGVTIYPLLILQIAWPLHLAIGVHLLSSLEEMLITHSLPHWRANVSSWWSLRRSSSPFTA